MLQCKTPPEAKPFMDYHHYRDHLMDMEDIDKAIASEQDSKHERFEVNKEIYQEEF